MPLTYHVCSVAVLGEGVLTEFSSPKAWAVMTFRAQLCHLLPLANCQGLHGLSSKERPLHNETAHMGQREQPREQGCTRLWNGCFRVAVSGDASVLGTRHVWTVKFSFASALTASKREACDQ